ncbi:MAG: hypothetical protein JOZ33_14190 [Acidobacteriaceae bacterium]|nr:hypothetical protein [Acidobacteriaceae bacterium]
MGLDHLEAGKTLKTQLDQQQSPALIRLGLVHPIFIVAGLGKFSATPKAAFSDQRSAFNMPHRSPKKAMIMDLFLAIILRNLSF